MAKIKGYNVRLYLGGDLLAHTTEVSLNLTTDTEELTDADSGDWKEFGPTLNSGTVDTTTWYNNAVAAGDADFQDVLDAYMVQSQLALVCEIEAGVEVSGLGYLTSLNPSGGTGAGYVAFTAGFIFTGEIS
jgi:hypothetical protein